MKMRQNGEPSVEEILQSIKQVIARDNRTDFRTDSRSGSRAERARRASEDLIVPEDEDDVLELQEAAQLAPDGGFNDGEDGDEDGREPSLVHAEVRNSMRESLAALAMLSEPGVPPQIVRSGETSLEGLTRDLLRPALTEWLDKNLPPMVERLVAAEIARIVGKRG